ncbi:hypothetical protein AOXY_G33949 [Acipenser oxyrinchus oxyrinchus]|uniref:Thyrotroph embryonic factor n=1 Tax=Acipenser oxyrinchus oxyrinchus TaxID=40147 RepID=A0AAD8CFN3_ACIOX|nr:hypothetical protein AOXY_G33949 [Acipenser oxyrinchus oxyrinchus]
MESTEPAELGSGPPGSIPGVLKKLLENPPPKLLEENEHDKVKSSEEEEEGGSGAGGSGGLRLSRARDLGPNHPL